LDGVIGHKISAQVVVGPIPMVKVSKVKSCIPVIQASIGLPLLQMIVFWEALVGQNELLR
jgi:hypothetical protein